MSVIWENPPLRQTVKNVDAGVVVLVRFWPTDPASILVEDSLGVPPHVVFRATIAPEGTGAFQHFAQDPVSGGIFPVPGSIGERPTASIDGLITPDNGSIDYDLDAGQPFLCPFPGTIQLIGGAFAGEAGPGPSAPYNVSVQVVMPQEVSLEYAGPVMLSTPTMQLFDEEVGESPAFLRRVHRATGWRPRRRPTMTYFNVTATPIPVPRGAVDVQVGANSAVAGVAQTITFDMGAQALGAHTVSLAPGSPMPLGAFSLGTFAQGADANLSWVSFGIEVA